MRKRRSGEEVWRLGRGRTKGTGWETDRREEEKEVDGFSICKKKTEPLVIELHEKDLPFSFCSLQPSPLLVPSLITIAAAELCVCVCECM